MVILESFIIKVYLIIYISKFIQKLKRKEQAMEVLSAIVCVSAVLYGALATIDKSDRSVYHSAQSKRTFLRSHLTRIFRASRLNCISNRQQDLHLHPPDPAHHQEKTLPLPHPPDLDHGQDKALPLLLLWSIKISYLILMWIHIPSIPFYHSNHLYPTIISTLSNKVCGERKPSECFGKSSVSSCIWSVGVWDFFRTWYQFFITGLTAKEFVQDLNYVYGRNGAIVYGCIKCLELCIVALGLLCLVKAYSRSYSTYEQTLGSLVGI